MSSKIHIICIFLFSTLVLSGCEDSGGGSSRLADPGKPGIPTMNAEVAQDKATVKKMSLMGPQHVDQEQGGAFTKLFGGTGGLNVNKYLDERVKHVLTVENMKKLTVTVSQGSQSESLLFKELWGEDTKEGQAELQMAAANVGTYLWIISDSQNLNVSLALPDGQVNVTSPRVGIIATAKYYKFLDEDQKYAMPLDGRMSILVHEGRHSDCPLNGERCGYAHTACPEGSEFAGQVACDDNAWGAYTVDMVYLAAAHINALPGSTTEKILNILLLDTLTRLTPETLEDIKTSAPDLSSK